MKTVDYKLTLPCDRPHARAREAIRSVNSPHTRLDGILLMQKILSEVGHVDVALVLKGFNRLQCYWNWDGWVKDLVFERLIRHRPSTELVS